MKPALEVLSYGEALVDFLPEAPGKRLRDVELFMKTSGGAPANAAIGIARLGGKVGLLGKVGDDEFGHFLRDHLERESVDIRGVSLTSEAKTGIAFISLDDKGDRSFLFFREPSADMTIRREDIAEEVIADTAAILFGSNLLTKPKVREATFHALDLARSHDVFITLDPNIRRHLWGSESDAREQVDRLLGYGDLVKMNEEELEFVTGGSSADGELQAVLQKGEWFFERVLAPQGCKAFVLTLAEHGAAFWTPDHHLKVPAKRVDVIDTTGAGDGFVAALLAGITRLARQEGAVDGPTLRKLVTEWDDQRWYGILRLACHVGSSVCTQFGATPALPHARDIPWETFGILD